MTDIAAEAEDNRIAALEAELKATRADAERQRAIDKRAMTVACEENERLRAEVARLSKALEVETSAAEQAAPHVDALRDEVARLKAEHSKLEAEETRRSSRIIDLCVAFRQSLGLDIADWHNVSTDAVVRAAKEMKDDLKAERTANVLFVAQVTTLMEQRDLCAAEAERMRAALVNAMRGADHGVDCSTYSDHGPNDCDCWVKNTNDVANGASTAAQVLSERDERVRAEVAGAIPLAVAAALESERNGEFAERQALEAKLAEVTAERTSAAAHLASVEKALPPCDDIEVTYGGRVRSIVTALAASQARVVELRATLETVSVTLSKLRPTMTLKSDGWDDLETAHNAMAAQLEGDEVSLTREEQERYANLLYKLGIEEPEPIAVCQNGHDQWAPIDVTKRRAGVPVCHCGALITTYHGIPDAGTRTTRP